MKKTKAKTKDRATVGEESEEPMRAGDRDQAIGEEAGARRSAVGRATEDRSKEREGIKNGKQHCCTVGVMASLMLELLESHRSLQHRSERGCLRIISGHFPSTRHDFREFVCQIIDVFGCPPRYAFSVSPYSLFGDAVREESAVVMVYHD